MTAGRADTTRLRAGALVGACTAAILGVVLCRLLASPSPSAWSGVLALAAMSLLLGLGLVPGLGGEPSPAVIAGAAGVWGAASAVGGLAQIAQQSGRSITAVGVGDLAVAVRGGLPVLVGLLGALAVLVWCVADLYADPPVTVVAVIAGVGVLAVSVTGHGSTSAWMPIVLGVHALCAAWWVGTLGALMATVRGRRGWAAALPEFSRWALPAVAALTVTGVVAAVAQIGVGPQLWETGYGRLLVAKALLLTSLVSLAAWHRRQWVPRAQRHQVTERESLRRAGTELLLLTLVLGLAAGLATTGTG